MRQVCWHWLLFVPKNVLIKKSSWYLLPSSDILKISRLAPSIFHKKLDLGSSDVFVTKFERETALSSSQISYWLLRKCDLMLLLTSFNLSSAAFVMRYAFSSLNWSLGFLLLPTQLQLTQLGRFSTSFFKCSMTVLPLNLGSWIESKVIKVSWFYSQ